MLVHMEWSFNFVFVLMISWESQKFGLKNFLSWLNFDSIICLSGSILTWFSTRLARSSNLKITRLDPTRQSMTRLARDSNNFRLDPPLNILIQLLKAGYIPKKIATELYIHIFPTHKTYTTTKCKQNPRGTNGSSGLQEAPLVKKWVVMQHM